MSTQELSRQTQRLDSCFDRVKKNQLDLELQADLSKHLCVLVSGYLENAVYELLVDHASKTSSPHISFYVERSLNKWTNPSVEKIINLFSMFKLDWKNELELFIVDEKKEHINSLVGLRHAIAHGESSTVTYSQVSSYYETVKKVVKKIEQMLA